MPEPQPFDCSELLRTWVDDPNKPVSERMLSLINCYSETYRRMILEIRRLEAENTFLRNLPMSSQGDNDLGELQRVVDASIAMLDPDRK